MPLLKDAGAGSAKAGIQTCLFEAKALGWIPACAGRTTGGTASVVIPLLKAGAGSAKERHPVPRHGAGTLYKPA